MHAAAGRCLPTCAWCARDAIQYTRSNGSHPRTVPAGEAAETMTVNTMMKSETFADWLRRCPLVAILRGVKPVEVVDIASALVETGFCMIEVPLNSPEPFDSIM